MPRVPETQINWSALPGLYEHLLLADVRARTPGVAVALAASVALCGFRWVPAALACCLTLAAQSWAVSPLASMIILPSQRRMLLTLRWAAALLTSAARAGEPPAMSLRDGLILRAARAVTSTDALDDVARMLTDASSQLGRHAALAGPTRARLLVAAGGVLHVVRTPDGVALDVCVFGGGAAMRPRGVLVYAGGNGELWPFSASAVASRAAKHGLTAVLFDYRGVGESGGDMSARRGGVIDVASVLAFCSSPALGYAPERILLLGHSIGGGFGVEAARFLRPGAAVSDRSFGRLSEVAMHWLLPACVAPGADALPDRAARWAVHELICHAALWEIDAAEHWLHIPCERKSAVFHVGDTMIPLPVQLAAHLATMHGIDARAWGVPTEPHHLAAAAASAQRAAPATDDCRCAGVVVQIGAGEAHSEDAHNRDFTEAESEAFFTRVALPMLDIAAGERPTGTLPAFLRL